MWSWLLEALLPQRCAVCRVLSGGSPFCHTCAQTIQQSDNTGHGDMLAGFVYTGTVRKAIRAAKFRPDQASGEALIAHWVQTYGKNPSLHETFDAVEAVCFVPVHWRRRMLRGFDFSSLVARAMAGCLGISVLDALVCRRLDPSLSKAASRKERIKMTAGRYELRVPACAVADKHVLLVDDVVTTGSTLRSATVPLQQAGAVVHTFALAATPLNNQDKVRS